MVFAVWNLWLLLGYDDGQSCKYIILWLFYFLLHVLVVGVYYFIGFYLLRQRSFQAGYVVMYSIVASCAAYGYGKVVEL